MANSILGIVPTMQATAIAAHTYKNIPKIKDRPKRATKKLIRGATGAIVGTSLLGATAGIIGGQK